MRAGINCRSFLNKHYTGIGRYAYNLVRSLLEIDQKNEYVLYAQKGLFDWQKRLPRFNAKNVVKKIDWFKRGTSRFLGDVDIYHLPSQGFVDVQKAKVVVTVHDLVYKAFPQGHTDETLRLTDEQFRSFLPRVSKIICPSQSTVNDLQKYFHVDNEKIQLIYQGVDKNLFRLLDQTEKISAKNILKARGIDNPFILFVGTIEPRKNLKNLLRAFAQCRRKKSFTGDLVVIGKLGWKSQDIPRLIQDLGIQKYVKFLGFVPDRELCWFYNLAEVFVFPSYYEGFGYPLVEAFCCGAAVVTSTVSSCPEIAADAALRVDPTQVDALAVAITRLVQDREFKNTLKQRALARAQAFDYEKTAKETLKIYQCV